ncbi:hypothetical protein HDV06_006428 [Boothiomyces sp. JEL0866]|nr:hypothetical protein HDV06_006428 [Boothiomyces sp. JEL0866]
MKLISAISLCLTLHVQAQLFSGTSGLFGNSNSNSIIGNGNSNSNTGNTVSTTTNNGVQIINTDTGNGNGGTGTTGQTIDQTGTTQDTNGQNTGTQNTGNQGTTIVSQSGGTDTTNQGSTGTQNTDNSTVTTTVKAPKPTANVTTTTLPLSQTATSTAIAAASSSGGNTIGTMAGIIGGIVGSLVLLFAIGSFLRYMQLERESQEEEKSKNRLTLQLKADLEAPIEHPPAVAVYEDWTLDRGTLNRQEEEYFSITDSYYATSENALLSDSKEPIVPIYGIPPVPSSIPAQQNSKPSAISMIYNDIILTEQELTQKQSLENDHSQIPRVPVEETKNAEPATEIAELKTSSEIDVPRVSEEPLSSLPAEVPKPKSPLVEVPKQFIQESPKQLVDVPKAVLQESPKAITATVLPQPTEPKAPVILPARKSSKNLLVEELPKKKVEIETKDKPLPPVVESISPAPSVETDIALGERRPSALSIVYDGILDDE